MGNRSSTDPKKEKLRESSPTEKLGDSSTVWRDRLEVVMKRGGCKESFTAFENCVEEAEKNKETMHDCFPILRRCIEAHPDNYQPYLAAEKTSIEQITKELDALSQDGEGFFAFMEKGGWKESLMAIEACEEEADKKNENRIAKCVEAFSMLTRCMEAHSDYYKPFLAVMENCDERVRKDFKALLFEEGSKAEG